METETAKSFSKFTSYCFSTTALNGHEAKAVTKEEDFLRKLRIQQNSLYMTEIVSNCSTPTREEFGTTDYEGDSAVHLKKLPSVSKEEFPYTTLSSPEREAIIQEENFFGLEYRSRAYSSPPCMVRRRVTDGTSRILLGHIEEKMKVVTDYDRTNF